MLPQISQTSSSAGSTEPFESTCALYEQHPSSIVVSLPITQTGSQPPPRPSLRPHGHRQVDVFTKQSPVSIVARIGHIKKVAQLMSSGYPDDMSLIAVDTLSAEPLDALRELALSEVELDELRWNQIAAARDAGASWAQVGEALGISRQSAWEYFTRRVRDELAANVEANSALSEEEAMDLAVEEVRAKRRSQRDR